MMFSLRIVNVDSYQSAPTKGYDICYSEFRGCEIYKVPIIRIFGITPAGQKGCLHVHGVFPYFSIRCKDLFPNVEAKSLRKYMHELALDIDKALNVASRNSSSHRHHVYKIVVTEHIPFYGYHEKAEEFLKIYFYNPFDVSRAAELMTNGVILNKFIQPYEAHIPYILQFFIDYNLFGMNLIHVSKFKFRASEDDVVSAASPLRNQTLFQVLDDSSSASNKIWRIGALNSSQISSLPRQTVCELEADCCSSEIMNRLNESSSSGKNPGLLAIWDEERQRRKAENDSSHITPVPSQERADFIETESENFYKKKLRKILESFDVYKVCQKDKTDHMSKGSEESSPSISDLSSTQDEEMLNLMLSLVNSHSTQLDDDSILGFNHENDIQNENVDDDETSEMSQLFTGELEEMWSSQAMNSDSERCRTNSSFSSTLMEQAEASSEDITIPQLDGAFDEDIDMNHKHSKKNKEKTAAVISEESLIKSCTLYQPIVRLSPTIFIKREIYSPTESRSESDFLSEIMDDSSSVLTPKSPNLPICVPVSKNAHCSLIMNIYENSNDVSIEHTCSNRNFAQCDSLVDVEDPSNIVFEIITNLIYKVECLTEGKVSCYEHLTEEYCGESCSNALFQALSPEEKKILKQIKNAPSDFKGKTHLNKRGSHIEPYLSLPIKKRIFNNSWNKDEFNQCDSCSHSLSLDLSKIGKEIVLVKKLSESDFLNHIRFNALKVVIPPLPLDLHISNKLTSNLKNDNNTSKLASPSHKKDSKVLSKKTFKSKHKISNSKEKTTRVAETKYCENHFSPDSICTTENALCKLSPEKIDSSSNNKLSDVLFLPVQYVNNESSQSSTSEMICDTDNKFCVNTDSNLDLNFKNNPSYSDSNSKFSVDSPTLENAANERNSRESKIPIIPDSFEPEIIPDSLDFLFSPENMDSIASENNENSEIVADNSDSEIVVDNSNSEIAVDNSVSEVIADNSDSEVVADNSNSEMDADNSDSEIIADNSDSEIVADNSDSEIVADNSNSEVCADNSNLEICADNSNLEICADKSNLKICADNLKSEIVADNLNSEMDIDNLNSQIIADNLDSEIVADNLNTEIVTGNLNSEIVTSNSNSKISSSLESSKITPNFHSSECADQENVHDNYLSMEGEKSGQINEGENISDNINAKNASNSDDNEVHGATNSVSDKLINSSVEERNTPPLFLSELRLYRRKKAFHMNQQHSPVNSNVKNELDDHHFDDDIEQNTTSIGSRVREKNACSSEVEYIGSTDKSKDQDYGHGIPVVQLEPCKDLIEKYCKSETDTDCLILREVTHEQKTPPTIKEKRFFRSRARQTKDLNLSSNMVINNKLGVNGPKYTTNTFLPPNRGRRNSLSNFSVRKTIMPVLRRRSVNFDSPDKKKLQSNVDFTNSSLSSEKNSIEQVYDFESPLNSAENDLDNSYFSRYSLKNKSTHNNLRKNISSKLSLKLNRRRNREVQDDYVPKHVTIDADSQKNVRPKRTLSVVSYNEEEEQPIEENQIVMKRFRRNNPKDIQNLPEIENSAPDDVCSAGDSEEISDWSIDDDPDLQFRDDPILQFRSREALKCIISKKKINIYASHKNEKLPIPKFKVRKKKKSNPLNVNIKLIKSSSDYFNEDGSDFKTHDSYYCIAPKKKKHSKKSKKKSRTFESAFDVKQKYKKHKESRTECLKNAILKYCNSMAKNKSSKISTNVKNSEEESFKNEKENTYDSLSLVTNYNLSAPKSDNLAILNSSSAEDNLEENRRSKNSLKMKLKLKRITTRSNEERIVVVDKELEGIDTESDDENKSVSSENISSIKPENDNENYEKQKSNKTLGTKGIKCDINDLKLKAKFKCPLFIENKKPEKPASYIEENMNKENYKQKIPKFKYKPLLANISKDLMSENDSNTVTNSLVKDASPDKIVIVSPKKKSPLKTAESIKKELAQLNEMACETKTHSDIYNAVSKSSFEISLDDNRSQKKVHIEEIASQVDDDLLFPAQCKLRERRLSPNSKTTSQRNSMVYQDFKRNFDDDEIAEEVSPTENLENCDSVSSDSSINCKPFIIDLKKMSSSEIEKYIHKPVVNIRKSEPVCESVVASFPSPIVDSKSVDSYIDPKKIFENLFTFSSPSRSQSPLHLNPFEISSLMIENDMSCGPFSNDSSEHSRKEISKPNRIAQNPLKPNEVFKSVERDDMGVLWNLAYLSPPQLKVPEKAAVLDASLDKKIKCNFNQRDNFSFDDLQKLVKQANETCSLSCNLIESESENSVIASNGKNGGNNCKESKISFENILDKNIDKVLNDLESIPSFSQTRTEFEEEQVMSNKSESCEVDLDISTVIKEEPKSDPVFKPEDSVPITEETLPNVRILDFQECLVESDSEMNPLLNDSEIDSVISSAEMILSNGMDSQSYEQCLQTDLATDSRNSNVENKLKLVPEEPKNVQIDDVFIKTDLESNLQKQLDGDLTCNNAIITAADTSSVLVPSYKNNTIPVLAINNQCQDASVNFATFDEQNLNANGQFLPVMLASVSVAENTNYVDDSAIVLKENEPDPQECVNFLEDNELLQSCSVSSTSDIENKNIQASNALGIPFNGEDDILSMIVKSCDIGEEFDGNMNVVEETEGESISSATLCDNLIDSNYVVPGSNFVISSQSGPNSFQTNSENAVSSSSENNLIQKGSEIVVIKTEPVDVPEVEQVVYELQDKSLNINPPSKNIKASEELGPDNVLLDTMIHSFYGDNSLYGIHSSGNNDSISLLCPTFQNSSFSQGAESLASGCNSASLRSSVLRTADNAVDTYKADGYLKNISVPQNDSLQLKSAVSNDKTLGILKNSFYVAHSFPKVSSKRFHFAPSIKPPTREFIENVLVKKEIVEDVKVKTVMDDSFSSNSSPSSQTSTYDDTISNVFRKSPFDEKEFSGLQNSRNLAKTTPHHDVKVPISSPVLYQDRNKPSFSFNHHLSSTPSTSHTKTEFNLPDVVVSPINKETGLIADTSKRKRKLIFDDDSDAPLKLFKSNREKMCDLYNKYTRNGSLNISADSLGNLSYSQIEGPTLENSRGFKVNSENYGDAQVKHEVQHLTVMSLEIHANTRNELKPNPKFDSVTAIFYCIYNDIGISNEEEVVGMIVVDPISHHQTPGQNSSETLKNYLLLCPGVKNGYIYCVENEVALFEKLVRIIREWDPDVLAGYEIQMSSWGYLIERAEVLNINLRLLLSRLIDKNEAKLFPVDPDPNVADQTADLSKLNIIGRIVLCVWRLMRKEVTLNLYSFENVYYHVLHKRTPLYAFQDLTNWFLGSQKEKVIRYYVIRVQGCIQFLEKLDVINRTSELARLFGIQFYEVLSRGSQFRVESMMLRTAAPMSYIPVSPSVRQRSHSRAPECVPLVLEPESRFYIDPVVVLDFQSLYPSMIIAYNYCFSTCLGRVEHFGKNVPFEFGCTSLSVPITLLQKLQNDMHVSPTGIAFIKSSVRRGVLPSMLEEILNTRIMVKQSMKKIKENNALKKLLDARQLGLKLIANVTYGYTGAAFSGRMPSVEVADSIVGKARETLERAIYMIENTSKWRAKVIYGDTDSLFILLPGRTKKQAFEIGQEIADTVTADNPKPVKLKFEKVYLPCVLQTKKRYVGFMYETVDQENPIFDAKGIETVRRDSCPATAKILEKSLKILFKNYDVSLVKNYVQKQFTKLLNGHGSIIDCIFAKEYRGISGYRPGACVPALEIAKKRLSKDPRSDPRVGERVPYVVVYGFPGLPIIQLVREPIELLRDPNLRINATYYITRVISPPLERVFNLLGADVKSWYTNLARTFKPTLPMTHAANQHKGTLSQYFVTLSCPSCEKPTFTAICDDCREDLQGTTIALNEKIRQWERTVDHLNQICGSCTKSASSIDCCMSLDCPMLFKLNAAKKDLSQAPYLRKVLANELF